MEKKSEVISIDNFSPYEQHQVISSPRSLEACSQEFVDPKNLLYMYFKL